MMRNVCRDFALCQKEGVAAGHDLRDILLFSMSALVLVWSHAVDPVKTAVSGIAHARREFHASTN